MEEHILECGLTWRVEERCSWPVAFSTGACAGASENALPFFFLILSYRLLGTLPKLQHPKSSNGQGRMPAIFCFLCSQASTLPKNMWPEDPARQGGTTAFFWWRGTCGQKARPHRGGAIAFLWWAVLSVRRRFGERAVLSACRPVLCLKICGLKTLLDRGELSRFFDEEGFVARKRGHTGGWEAIAFLWWTVLSARRPAPCLKICGLNTLLDRGSYSVFSCLCCLLYCER